MAEEKIEIKLTVNDKQAIESLKKVEGQVDSLQDATEQAGNTSTDFFIGVAKGAATAVAAYATLKTAINAVEIGSQIADVNNAFDRLTKQIGVSADELKTRFSDALGGTLTAFDATRKANELLVAGINPDKFDELAQTARALADTLGIDTAQALDQVSDSLLRGNDRALKAIGVHVDLQKAQQEYAKALGTTADKLDETQKLEASRVAIIAQMETQLTRLGAVENDAADNLAKISNNLKNVRDDMLEVIANSKTLNTVLEYLANIKLDTLKQEVNNIALGFTTLFNVIQTGSWTTGYFKTMADLMAEQRVQQEKLAKANVAITDTEKKHESALNDLLDTTVEKIAKDKESQKTVDAMTKMYGTNTVATGGNSKAVKELAKSYELAESHVEKFRQAQEKELATLREAQGEYEELMRDKAKAMTDAAPVLGSVFNGLGIDSNSLSQSIAGSLESALAEGISLALSGVGNSEDYRATATQLGGEIGTAIGGPVIGAFAEQLTNDIVNIGNSSRETFRGVASAMFGPMGGALADGLFGDSFADSAGTALKKSLDKIFTDVGYDFTFSGNQDLTKGLFAGLGAQAQEQFSIAGDALTTFLGGSTDLGVNLGTVFANNNVHLAELSSIIESVGGSFEGLAATMYETFYDGELSVLQLQDRLEELYGIIDGSNTFQNLGDAARSALTEDGRVLLAAIKAIGKEAEQLGISTFPQMASVLVNQFGLAADQVQAILASISAAGVNSINALANAGQNVTTAIGANLEQVAAGQTPNNTPVAQPVQQAARSSGSSSPSRSSTPARKTENKAAAARRELASLFNKVQSSGRGRELEKQVSDGIITDGAYVTALQGMVDELKPLLKQLDSEEKQYLDALKKGKDKTKIEKELSDFVKLEKKVADLLSGSTKAVKASINSEFLDYVNKFGDSLGGLEIAAKNAGIAFESMEEKAFNAFLSGSKTFAEAKKELEDARGGVSGKQGAVGEALSKYIEAGTSGGVFSLKALQGIAGEARELGATTLDNLSEALLSQGIDRDVVQKLFIGFQNAGVDSLEAIEGAGAELGINLGAILQDLQFPFKETSSTIRDMARELAQIPSSKKVEVELSAIVDPKTREILDKLGLLPEGFGTPDVTSPSYDDTSLGLTKKSVRAEYRRLKSIGKLTKAANYKARYASYF
jgi:hypothetical protein